MDKNVEDTLRAFAEMIQVPGPVAVYGDAIGAKYLPEGCDIIEASMGAKTNVYTGIAHDLHPDMAQWLFRGAPHHMVVSCGLSDEASVVRTAGRGGYELHFREVANDYVVLDFWLDE